MINYKILQLLFLISSVTSQMIGMMPAQKKEIGEGIAQKIEGLPKELRYDIFSSALALRETPKYEVYKKIDTGSEVTEIALNADNTRVLTVSDDGVARLWDVEKGKLLKELKGHISVITSVALSASGALALTGSVDGTARVWNTDTGELITTLQVGSTVYSVALSADGTVALTRSKDGIGRLYTSTGELLTELKGDTSVITSVALSADGTVALTGSDDKTAQIWDLNTGELIRTLQVGKSISYVALSANGSTAVIGGLRKVQVWDVKSGTLLNTLLTDKYVYSLAVSKDGKRVLVGTANGTIQVWNTQPLAGQKETSKPLTMLVGHTGPVMSVAFSDADFIASGSFDKTVIIWKPFALEPRGPQEHKEVLRRAYKETFSRPLLRSAIETKQA